MKIATLTALFAASIGILCATDLQSPKPSGLTTVFNPQALPCMPVDNKTYVIGAEDQLSVVVFEAHNFDVQQSVRPDGMISMPLIGDVMTAGKTPEEAEAAIASLLHEKYMNDMPHVNIVLQQVNSRFIFIQGEVNRPGRYLLTTPTRIFEALVNAGGFKDFANQTDIPVLRNDKVFARFNFKDAIKGKHPERNVQLQPGDIIVVK